MKRFILIDQKTTNVFDDLTYRWIVFDTKYEGWCSNPKTKREAQDIIDDWNKPVKSFRERKNIENMCKKEPKFALRMGHLTLYIGGAA